MKNGINDPQQKMNDIHIDPGNSEETEQAGVDAEEQLCSAFGRNHTGQYTFLSSKACSGG